MTLVGGVLPVIGHLADSSLVVGYKGQLMAGSGSHILEFPVFLTSASPPIAAVGVIEC